MQALLLTDYRKLEYTDVPKPALGPHDVLIAVRACGICGSDIHGYDGSSGRRIPPLVMGHESAGVVAELGSEASRVKTGDRVTSDSTLSCGRCDVCRRGEPNLCPERRILGVACDEFRQHGAFAQYVAVPEHALYPLPPDMPFEHAAFVEPVSVALHAVARVTNARGRVSFATERAATTPISPVAKETRPLPRSQEAPGPSSVVVVGSGMIGLLVIQSLRVAGCDEVIAVDLDPSRLELAKELGASLAIDARSADPVAAVRDHTDGRGADLAMEVVGNPPALATAIGCVRRGGQVVLVGNVSPQVPLPLQVVVARELTLLGSCASAGEYPRAIELIASGAIRVAPLITAVAPLAEGPHWFERLYAAEPNLMKVILQP